ncbi:MAG: hypothetical protein ACR2M2_03845 [Gaiellaceae bacterium]
MNTPIRSAETSVDVLEIAKGESQSSAGFTEPSGALPSYTLKRATPARSRSAPTCRTIITSWSSAASSVPRMQIAVMTTMYATARTMIAVFDPAAASAPERPR